jgi:hypothetical protein
VRRVSRQQRYCWRLRFILNCFVCRDRHDGSVNHAGRRRARSTAPNDGKRASLSRLSPGPSIHTTFALLQSQSITTRWDNHARQIFSGRTSLQVPSKSDSESGREFGYAGILPAWERSQFAVRRYRGRLRIDCLIATYVVESGHGASNTGSFRHIVRISTIDRRKEPGC